MSPFAPAESARKNRGSAVFVIVRARDPYYLSVSERRSRPWAAITILWGVFAPAPANARAAERLHYRAPAGCPTQAEFVVSVAERGGRFESRAPEAEQSSFDVAVEQREDGFHAELTTRSGGRSSKPREVQAPTCAQVVDALAAVTAIALNPPAVPEPEPTPVSAEPAPLPKPRAPPCAAEATFGRRRST